MTRELLVKDMEDKISVLKSIAKNEPGLVNKANYEIKVYEERLKELQGRDINNFDIDNKDCQT